MKSWNRSQVNFRNALSNAITEIYVPLTGANSDKSFGNVHVENPNFSIYVGQKQSKSNKISTLIWAFHTRKYPKSLSLFSPVDGVLKSNTAKSTLVLIIIIDY